MSFPIKIAYLLTTWRKGVVIGFKYTHSYFYLILHHFFQVDKKIKNKNQT